MATKLTLSLEKLDKLADDVAKLDMPRVVKAGDKIVPSFQKEGYLEEANKKTLTWVRRFFVLRDSCLLSYDSEDIDKIVEPQTSVCLGKCKVQLLESIDDLNKLVGGLIDCAGKEHCIHVTTRPDKEHVLLCASTAEERESWVEAIRFARTVTHANMVKLSVENRVLAEEKGAAEVALAHSTTALSIFSNKEYIQKTPIAGGAEGWLKTVGFKKVSEHDAKKTKLSNMLDGLFGPSELKKLKKRYCILRDSHLMLYDAGDALLKPRGVLYLVGTTVEPLDDDETGTFRFRCSSPECGDYIDFVASTEKRRTKWMFALKIGSRVTYPDFRMLMEEHSLLSNALMTPRAGAPPAPYQPAGIEGPQQPQMEDIDLQDAQLDPGTEQPFDVNGAPLIRNPNGKFVDINGIEITPSTPRFSSTGVQLDNFNRPIPPGAVPMFNEAGAPIGVGPDGGHYLADGTEIPKDAPHYDVSGAMLDAGTVQAADAVVQHLNVALKVHSFLTPRRNDAVDVLGRTFRESTSNNNGFVNADGDFVPLASARRYDLDAGMVTFEQPAPATQATILTIVIDNDDDAEHTIEVGSVEVDSNTTLRDVRLLIKNDVEQHYPDFLFLIDMTPLLKYEEANYLAIDQVPSVHIRGKELNKSNTKIGFTKKVSEMIASEEQKKQEQREFEDVLARIRTGKFLKPVAKSWLEP
eukprot:c9571_g1_i1.p1 GENE.c9571_g1_i1~~c9571_g1_i1.p1  ORF type:complete len:706 (-),score=223.93 c9571_g1_i1:44-2119(-)